jgi:hypothetical protein
MKIWNFFFLLLVFSATRSSLLPRSIAEWVLKDFEEKEKIRAEVGFHGRIDRRSSNPFITGDGFRSYCNHICEDHNTCKQITGSVQSGDSIFIKADFVEFFVNSVLPLFPRFSNFTYLLVTHNGDISSPDGQTDAPAIDMPMYIASDKLQKEYENGRLLALHAQNLWWRKELSPGGLKPAYAHCLPIGIENRQWHIGKNHHFYLDAMKQFILSKELGKDGSSPSLSSDLDNRPLLLISFHAKQYNPDREKALRAMGIIDKDNKAVASASSSVWYNYTEGTLSHAKWLQAITEHKFIAAPAGHGLDTHRISEILMMGGIPVMKKSSISSCYDDSDNTIHGNTRGSLPVVIVDRWEDVTKERLEIEWKRIREVPINQWDWNRAFIYHWIERIFGKLPNQILP